MDGLFARLVSLRFYHALGREPSPELRQAACGDGLAQARHELQVVMEVMQRIEARAEDLAGAMEMVQVGAAEVAAGGADAVRVEGAGIVAMARVLYPHRAPAREEPTVAGVPCPEHPGEEGEAPAP